MRCHDEYTIITGPPASKRAFADAVGAIRLVRTLGIADNDDVRVSIKGVGLEIIGATLVTHFPRPLSPLRILCTDSVSPDSE